MRVIDSLLLFLITGISVLISVVTSKGHIVTSCPKLRCESDHSDQQLETVLTTTTRDVHKSSITAVINRVSSEPKRKKKKSYMANMTLNKLQQNHEKNSRVLRWKRSKYTFPNHNNNIEIHDLSVLGHTTNKTPTQSNYTELNKLPHVYIKKHKKLSDIRDAVPNKIKQEIDKNRTRFLPQIKKLQNMIVEEHALTNIINETYKNYNASMIVFLNRNVTNSVDKARQSVIADMLAKEVRVLCWLFDTVEEHLQNAAYVIESWGTRCNVLLFMSNHSIPLPPIINLPQNNETSFFNSPMKEAFKYAFEHHRDDADWFMMVDYTTFLVLENLRYMLLEYISTNPIWLYNRILSRGGLDSFIWHAENNLFGCAYDDHETDMLSCLENVGVKLRDTTDEVGCSRYIDVSFFSLISAAKSIRDNIEKLNIFKAYKDCNSDKAVAFQLNSTKDMTPINYMIYHLRPYGINHKQPYTEGGYPLQELHFIRVSNWWRLFSKAYKSKAVTKQSQYPNGSTALALAKDVRVLCWVLTHPKNHERRAANIKATWGKRCNTLLFMSTQYDPSLPTVVLPVEEGWNYIWGKTRAAFKYIYDNYRDDADWFLKVDDDTFVIVENLRYMLSSLNRSDALYTGCWFKISEHNENYMSGGAGYVLSREALDRFVNEALTSPSLCTDTNLGAEDVNMGKCLANVGVKFLDSRDSLGRASFLPFAPSQHLSVGLLTYDQIPWYWNYLKYNISEGIDCCSQFAITFHYVTPAEMHEFYYLLYEFHLFGVSYDDEYMQYNRTPHRPRKYKNTRESSKPQSLIEYLWKLIKIFL